MQIEIQLFSILRECLPVRGRGDPAQGQMVTVPDGATLADLVASLGIDRRLGCSATELSQQAGWQVFVGGRPESNLQCALQEGDQVRILPPVSGGS